MTLLKRSAGFLGLALLWQICAQLVRSPLLVGLDQIARGWVNLLQDGTLLRDVLVSMQRICLGFSVAVILGVGLGIGMTRYNWLRMALMPVVDTIRPISALSLFPLIIVAMGIGEASKVFVILWTAWPACLLNTLQGLGDVEHEVIEAAQLDGANPDQLLVHITLPLAFPVIMTGLRIGLSGGWISLVAAEMLGSNSGLGFSVMMYSQTFHFSEMYAIIFTIALLGLGMNLLAARLQTILSYNGGSNESRFIRFGDRSAGWNIDSLFTRRPHRDRAAGDPLR